MSFRNFAALFLFFVCSCTNNEPNPKIERFFGANISNSIRKGHSYTDKAGAEYFYAYIRVTITNDSLIPMKLKIAFKNEYYQPTPTNGQKFKVFLIPENRTNEKQTDFDFLNKFLDQGLENPISLNKVLFPKEECVLNIGFLTGIGSTLNPSPFVLFSKGHKQNFQSISDSLINNTASDNNQLTLLLGLDFYSLGLDSIKRYSIIPCGQISYCKL